MFWPSTAISPSVASSKPAITESSVVFPHPLGPTNIVISPKRTSKSTPRKTSARLSPVPNSFLTCRQETALLGISVIVCMTLLTSKYDCWLQHQHSANAHQAGQDDDHDHG